MHAAMKSSRLPGAFASGACDFSGATGIGSPGCFTEKQMRPPCLPTRTRRVWLSIMTGAGRVSPPAGAAGVDFDGVVDVDVVVDGDVDVAAGAASTFCTAPPVSFFHVSSTPFGGLKQSASVSPAYWINFGQSMYGPISARFAGSMFT